MAGRTDSCLTRSQHEYLLKELAKPNNQRPTQQALGKKLGISQSTVWKWSQRPLGDTDKSSTPEAADDPDTSRVARLLAKPRTVEELADLLDLSPKRTRATLQNAIARGAMFQE